MSERIRGSYDDALYKSTYSLCVSEIAIKNSTQEFVCRVGRYRGHRFVHYARNSET